MTIPADFFAAADEEAEIPQRQLEIGRGERARGLVAAVEGVGETVASEAAHRGLFGEHPFGRRVAEGSAGRGPTAKVAALEIGDQLIG